MTVGRQVGADDDAFGRTRSLRAIYIRPVAKMLFYSSNSINGLAALSSDFTAPIVESC